MKFNIFNYNQKKACELGLDLKDLLILDWFQTFQPRMHKTIRNNKQYYWVKYDNLIIDIPIIEITTPKGLYKRLQNLCNIGLLEYLPIRTAGGCFSYYLITEKIHILISSHSSESSTGSSESSTGSSESSDAIYNSSTINDQSINSLKINKKEILVEKIENNEFEKLWTLYGKIGNKKQAEKSFLKAIKTNTVENIEEGIKKYLLHLESIKKANFYPIKHFSTWLNNECWKDEYNQKISTIRNSLQVQNNSLEYAKQMIEQDKKETTFEKLMKFKSQYSKESIEEWIEKQGKGLIMSKVEYACDNEIIKENLDYQFRKYKLNIDKKTTKDEIQKEFLLFLVRFANFYSVVMIQALKDYKTSMRKEGQSHLDALEEKYSEYRKNFNYFI